MKKLIKSSLAILALLPVVSLYFVASENEPLQANLPTTDKVYNITFEGGGAFDLKPGDVIPNPTYTGSVPEGQQFNGWANDEGFSVGQTLPELEAAQKTIIFTPVFVTAEQQPTPPPAPQPTPEIKVRYETDHNDITMVKPSDLSQDVLALANVKVYKIVDTYLGDQLVTAGPREEVTAVITNNGIGAEAGQTYPVEYRAADDENAKVFSCNFLLVPATTTISEDRALGINIAKGDITITNQEARNLTTTDELIALNGVTAFNAQAMETVAVINNETLTTINSGKAGTYQIQYGILRSRTPFIATTTITVEPGIEVPPTQLAGGVDTSQVAQTTGNNKIVSQTGEEISIVGARTGVASAMSILVIYLVVSSTLLVILTKSKR